MDVDFTGGWSQEVGDNADNVMSRTRMVILYADYKFYRHSSRQKEIAVSIAEAYYIALSSALRELIPLMKMMGEIY